MTKQHGEAFYKFDPKDPLKLPPFLVRKRGAKPDTTPMPKWVIEGAAKAADNTWSVGRKTIEDVPDASHGGIESLSGVELQARMLKQGVRAEFRKMDAENAKAKDDRVKARRDKRLGIEAAAVVEDAPAGGRWDPVSGRWQPEGYMARSRYRRLLAEMPDDAHRKCFIEMFGHTQKPEDREPTNRSLSAIRRGVRPPTRTADPSPVKDKPKPAELKAGAPAGGPRTLNPEHDAKVSAMLLRPEGASLPEIGSAMGWQNHSASAFLSGIRKTRTIVKTVEGERGNVYRLEQKS